MKFGQLTEYNMRNISLINSKQNEVKKLFPDPILKNKNWVYLWINSLKFYTVCCILCQVEGHPNIVKLSCRPLALAHIKLFNKRGLEIVSLPHFLHDFWRKTFILLYSINWPNFIFLLILLRQILGNMCIAVVYLTGCDVINFEINLILQINPFFLYDQNVKTKI